MLSYKNHVLPYKAVMYKSSLTAMTTKQNKTIQYFHLQTHRATTKEVDNK